MNKYIVRGGKELHGDVYISGMKNSALPVIFASILTKSECIIENIPDVRDISLSFDILETLGAEVTKLSPTSVRINTAPLNGRMAPYEQVSKMRGSSYLIGALLGRFGESKVGWPGGCDFGTRPIDQHLKGFEALGAITFFDDGFINATAPDGLRGNSIYFDVVSVGATINIIIAATLAQGVTVIENAAREPHVSDLANFLNACGADISGAGTASVRIRGVRELHGCTYKLVPDMIEAGTYMVAAAAAGGCVNVHNVIPKHMETVTAKLCEMGIGVDVHDNFITVTSDRIYNHVNIKTLPYPGFPTDMHPQFGALLCLARGVSIITENIWENRFKYTAELMKMGAVIDIDRNTAMISGVSELHPARLHAADLRAGAALIIAALCADGESEITGVESVERGYYRITDKLTALGADIKKISD